MTDSSAVPVPTIRSLIFAAATCKGVGMAIAWLLEHPRAGPVRDFFLSRYPLRPLMDYTVNWSDAIATECAVIAIEAAALGVTARVLPASAGGSLLRAVAIADSAAARLPVARMLRFAPYVLGPTVRSTASFSRVVLPSLTPSCAWAFALSHAIRSTVRTGVTIALRHWGKGDTYLRPAGVATQAVAQGVVSGVTTFAATACTFALLHRDASRVQHRKLVWDAVFLLSWSASASLATRAVKAANRALLPLALRALYRPLPGVNNPRQGIFDLQELNNEFSSLSATELSEVSQFANEALRSKTIDHNTRLHAVRFLAAMTTYVKAVNTGALSRASRVSSTTSLSYTSSSSGSGRRSASPAVAETPAAQPEPAFQSHVFTEAQIQERAGAGNPFTCASCGVAFRAKDTAALLPCGHILHAGKCSELRSDWCPQCARPTHSPSNDERMAVFIGMKAYVEALATRWETERLIPQRLNFVEWGYVAQYVRRHRVVEGEVPLDIVPAGLVPGQHALLDLPLAYLLWALRIRPTEEHSSLFVVESGW